MTKSTDIKTHLWILSYHFPPSTAAGGARAESLAKYIVGRAEFDASTCHVGVCCGGAVDPKAAGKENSGVSKGYEILRVPFESLSKPDTSSRKLDGRNALKSKSRFHGLLKSIAKPMLDPMLDMLKYPDRYHSWANSICARMQQQLNGHNGKTVVLSSGPPHSIHIAAQKLKRDFGCAWIMDLRDPWIRNPFRNRFTFPAEYLDQRLERICLREADAIVLNTQPALELLCKRYGAEVGNKSHCVPNGYQEDEFQGIEANPLWHDDGRLVILYAGSLYGQRTGGRLLAAIARLKKQGIPIPRLILLGGKDVLAERDLIYRLNEANIEGDVEIIESVPKQQALGAMVAASALVLIGDNHPEQLQVPSKLFEYLRIGKPILAIYPKHSPVSRYLHDYCEQYWQVDPDDDEGLEVAITSLAQALMDSKVTRDSKRPITELSREYQNRKLFKIIEGLQGDKPSGKSRPDR